MATESTTVVTKRTPYQLDLTQTTQACRVLLRHIDEERERRDADSTKQDLLSSKDSGDQSSESADDQDPVWLIVTTKKHIVDQKRLKPNKITLPHSIHTSPTSTICLITADPQSTYTALLTAPSFPAHLRSRITKCISLTTLKKNYSTFEARRQLAATHDLFLADDRIVTHLPSLLGKVFYKNGSKRPIPVNIGEPRKGEDGKRTKLDPANARKNSDKIEGGRGAASAEAVGREIDKALGSALVHLAPGASTAVKVAKAGMKAEEVMENVQAVMEGLVGRFISKGWRNVRAVHVKGPNTMAFPVWLADELWLDEEDVLEEKKSFGMKGKTGQQVLVGPTNPVDAGTEEKNKKRKADEVKKPTAAKHVKKKRKVELEAKLAAETSLRKQALKKQKEAIIAEVL